MYFEDTGTAYMYMYSIEIQKSLVKTTALSSNAHILKNNNKRHTCIRFSSFLERWEEKQKKDKGIINFSKDTVYM